jgi:hypothetical protein
MNEKLEQCNLKNAEFLKVNNSKFSYQSQEFGKYKLDSAAAFVDIRVEFDRWIRVEYKDFELLGITCWKTKEPLKFTFDSKIVAHSMQMVDNHGLNYEVLDSVCVVLPDQFIEYLDQEVEITVKVKKNNYEQCF